VRDGLKRGNMGRCQRGRSSDDRLKRTTGNYLRRAPASAPASGNTT
jgi:hypothetical protein